MEDEDLYESKDDLAAKSNYVIWQKKAENDEVKRKKGSRKENAKASNSNINLIRFKENQYFWGKRADRIRKIVHHLSLDIFRYLFLNVHT